MNDYDIENIYQLEQELEKREKEITKLKEEIALLKQSLYGKKSTF